MTHTFVKKKHLKKQLFFFSLNLYMTNKSEQIKMYSTCRSYQYNTSSIILFSSFWAHKSLNGDLNGNSLTF